MGGPSVTSASHSALPSSGATSWGCCPDTSSLLVRSHGLFYAKKSSLETLYTAQESTYFSSPLNPLSLCIPVVIISKSGPDFFPQYETVYFPLSSPVFSPVLSADQRTSSLAYELFSRMEEKSIKPLHLSQPILATAIRNHTFYEPLLFFRMRFTGDLARKSACMNVLRIQNIEIPAQTHVALE